MGNFAERFLRGHEAGRRDRALRDHDENERERLRQDAERARLEARRADATLKLHEMQANNAATQTALAAAAQSDAPTVPVDPAAGGVGPPAPAPRPTLPIQLPGGQTLGVQPKYGTDIAIENRATADAAAAQKDALSKVDVSALGPLLAKMIGPQAAASLGGSVDREVLPLIAGYNAQQQANVRDASTAPRAPIQVETVDAAGNPVVQVMDPSAATGRTFPRASKTDPAQGKAYLKDLQELPERVQKAQSILKTLQDAKDAHAKLTVSGPVVGRWTPGTSAAAQRLTAARSTLLTRNSPVKGQGAVSDFERRLADNTVPGDSVDPQVAAGIYDQMISDAQAALDADKSRLDEARQWRASRGVGARPGAAPPLGKGGAGAGADPLGLFN